MCSEREIGWEIRLVFDKRILRWFRRMKREGYSVIKGKYPELLSSPLKD